MTAYSLTRDALLSLGGLAVWLPAILIALPFGLANVRANAAPGAPASALAAALELIDATPAASRSQLRQPFTDAARDDWHYTPRRRTGIPWRDMSAAQRQAATRLLSSALTDAGIGKVRAVMALEIALRELGGSASMRDPENYAIALFGMPSSRLEPWGWRIEGHHLSLHFTLVGDRYIATLPQFMGANPALVPRDMPEGGPRRGAQALGIEEERARALLSSLTGAQRTEALFDTRPYGDIITRNAAKVSPLAPVGVKLADLSATQQAALLELVSAFAEHLRPELAEARLAAVRAGGLDTIRFGWAGSLAKGEPHYFRIQGSRFLIEFDNSGGNHIHSVWRDFDGDWGRDALRDHYAGAAGAEHSHSNARP